jgi:hypothetical protein
MICESEPEFVCVRCGLDLDPEEYPKTYGIHVVEETKDAVFMHDDEDCNESPVNPFYDRCACCSIKYDLSEGFIIDDAGAVYCSVACKNKHSSFCIFHVEEPDIVY